PVFEFGGLRTLEPGWWHHARTHFVDYFFEDLGVLSGLREIDVFEHQAARFNPGIVASRAVLRHDTLFLLGIHRPELGSGLLRACLETANSDQQPKNRDAR